MRKQVLAASICLSLALTPAVSAASPNGGEALTEETRAEEVRNGEAPAEEAASAGEPMAAQADPQAPAAEEAPSATEEPAMPGEPEGREVERVELNVGEETGGQPPEGPDDALAPQAAYTESLSDGVPSSSCRLYPGGGGAEFTFTLSHRSRVEISYEILPYAALGTYHIQLYGNTASGPLDSRDVRVDSSGISVYDISKTYELSLRYCDNMTSPESLPPGQYKVVVWYSNPYDSSYCLSMVKLSIEPLFGDLPKDHWAASVVADAVDRGYMSGYDPTYAYEIEDANFGTDDKITRAQVATILWNMQGRPKPGSTYSFRDVNQKAYYASAVAWAKSAGVVSGYGDGSFKPAQSVSRQELAVMLYNYAVRCRKASTSGAGWSSYYYMYDSDSVSWYASDAVGWCFYRDVMSGSGGYVRPEASATRAEAAKMFLYTGKLLGL